MTDRQEGTRRLYRVDQDGLEELRAYLESFWDDALAQFKKEVERTDTERSSE